MPSERSGNFFPTPWIRPKWLALSATWNCNAKCRFCNLWQTKGKTHMRLEDLQAATQDKWFDCIENVAFFGGEPTLNPELPMLYAYARERWPWAVSSVVTWGGTQAVRDRLIEMSEVSKLLWVCVSLDGDRETHATSRGKPTAYDEAIKTAKLAKSLFEPRLRFSYTATGATAGQLRHVLDVARSVGADVSMRPVADGSYFNTLEAVTAPSWTAEQIDELEEAIKSASPRDLAMPGFAAAIPDFLRTGEHIDCQAAVHAIVCDPDLQARVCHNLPPMCHLKDYPTHYAQDPRWWEANDGACFKKSCFIDGPYSIGYAFRGRTMARGFSRLPVAG